MNAYVYRLGYNSGEGGWVYFTATELNGMIDILTKIKYNVVSRSKVNPSIEYKADPYYHYTFKCSALLNPTEYAVLRGIVIASRLNDIKIEYYIDETSGVQTNLDVSFKTFPEVKNDGRIYKQLYKFTIEATV
jgi:hypothetical protein